MQDNIFLESCSNETTSPPARPPAPPTKKKKVLLKEYKNKIIQVSKKMMNESKIFFYIFINKDTTRRTSRYPLRRLFLVLNNLSLLTRLTLTILCSNICSMSVIQNNSQGCCYSVFVASFEQEFDHWCFFPTERLHCRRFHAQLVHYILLYPWSCCCCERHDGYIWKFGT